MGKFPASGRWRLASLLRVICTSLTIIGLGAQAGAAIPVAAASGPASQPPQPLEREARVIVRAYMNQMKAGAYASQWAELAPIARAQWPSEEARTAMLDEKFSGVAKIVAFALGLPRPASSWQSRENPDQSVPATMSVPVAIRFADPSSLAPSGAAADYRSLEVTLAVTGVELGEPQPPGSAGPQLEIVGEGPASLDAPLLEPAEPLPARADSVPVLMYHLVGPLPDRADYSNSYSYQLDYGLTVPTQQFTSEMAYLNDGGYTSISLVRLADSLWYGLPLPSRPVVITFDDGFVNEYQYAVPVLREDDLTATFLPCSGLIGQKSGQERYMTAADLANLADTGFWIEDHTYNDGTKLWGRTPGVIDALAGGTASVLERISGEPIQFISYSGLWPFASPAQDGPGEKELFSELRPLGYVGGLEDNWVGRFAWRESTTGAGLFDLPRVRAFPGESLAEFAALLQFG